MKKRLVPFLVLAGLVLVSLSCGKGKQAVVVGAKDFTEQDILGHMIAMLIKEKTDIPVTYKHEMASNIIFAAIKNGDVDLFVDYTGTVYGNYFQHSEMKSADEVYRIAVRELKDTFNILMLTPLGFNNTYTLSVRPDTAEKYGLKTYSDLAKVSGELILGATFDIYNRNDGIPNLKKTYDMKFKEEKAVEGSLRYIAIEQDEIQITNAFSTDGMLDQYNLMVLEDNKSFFPPYHSAIIIRWETTEKYPELLPLLDKLSGLINDQTMRGMNYRVDVLRENPEDVARDFLMEKSLIK
jgi:glycine betaine/choline ABC-type transport system substrate-binding protein